MRIIQKRKILMILIISASVAMLTACSNRINLMDYALVETIGVNERGIAQVAVDEDQITQDLIKAGKFDVNDPEDQEIIASYLARIRYEVTPSSQLKNGDAIVVKAFFTNENNDLIRISEGEAQRKVEGLVEGEKIDLFDYIDLELSGISPNASAEVIHQAYDRFFKSMRFELSKEEGLANGDQVEVKVLYDPYLAAEMEYYVLADSKVFTIEGVPAYMLEASDLTDEVMEGFRAEGEYILGEFTKTELATSLDNLQFDLDKTVIATIKDPEEIKKGGKANSLVFLYEMQGTQGENTYAAIFFNNIVKDGTGRIAPVHQQGNVGIWGKDKAEIDKFIMEDTEVKYNLTVTE